MKTFTSAILAATMCAGAIAAPGWGKDVEPNWVQVTESISTITYIDTNSINKSNDIVSVWVKTEGDPFNGELGYFPFKGFVQREVYFCKEAKWMPKGEQTAFYKTGGTTTSKTIDIVVPIKVSAKLIAVFNIVCK